MDCSWLCVLERLRDPGCRVNPFQRRQEKRTSDHVLTISRASVMYRNRYTTQVYVLYKYAKIYHVFRNMYKVWYDYQHARHAPYQMESNTSSGAESAQSVSMCSYPHTWRTSFSKLYCSPSALSLCSSSAALHNASCVPTKDTILGLVL